MSIDKLLQSAAQNQLNIPSTKITFDGTFKRFPVDKSRDAGWVISHKNPDGSIIATYGNWKTGSKHVFHTGKTKPDIEKLRAADELYRIAKIKAEGDKEKANELAAQKADSIWHKAKDCGTSEYLIRKKIPQLFGARILDENILVPMKIGDKLLGIQTIYPDGFKKFLSGQKFKGTYFIIGTPTDEMFLCEGFATGCSLYMATGMAVICAFSAQNLISVAQSFIGFDIIVAADNDRFNKENAGVKCAKIAGKILSALIIIPDFPENNKGTDFNDLHVDFGLDAVTKELENVRGY